MEWRIRVATEADEVGVQETIREVFDEYGFAWDPDVYHSDLYDLEQHYLSLGNPFWVAEDAGGIVGTVALEFFEAIPGELGTTAIQEGKVRVAGADCSLERLYVRIRGRRRGIGSALNQTAIAQARQSSRTAMEVWSDKRFVEAHRLYQGLGATIVGDRICDDPDLSPEWGLLLTL
ncbi:MAG: GNAT family N-acetyltransferase [Fimbriimonas sp.]